MILVHVLSGLALLGVSVYALTCSLSSKNVSAESWKILTVFSGLLLAFLLFTGFIQLGSRHTVHRFVLYKLGLTVTGGILLLGALILRLRGFSQAVVIDATVVVSIFLFVLSLYFGIVL